jgi:hypothetical protein
LPDSVLKDGKYDSVFEKHKFHNKETDENRGTGIFRRSANQGLTTSEAID